MKKSKDMKKDGIKEQLAKPAGDKPKNYPKVGEGKELNWKNPNGTKK